MSLPTINQALRTATQKLSESSPSASADARLLLCHVLGQNPTYLYTWSDKILSAEQSQHFEQLIEKRALGEPVAYITGERGFWTFTLKTADCTLIPREETECLVEQALAMLSQPQAKVLDLGTGTGAIALALASERPQWQVFACDYNHDAVALAQENARDIGLCNVDIRQSDWFGAFAEHQQSFDLIVSNPPYIAPDDPHLELGDLRFEPVAALAAENEGYADVFHIIEQAKKFLRPDGLLMIEHGFEQGQKIRQHFTDKGFEGVATHKDLAALERFTSGRLPSQSTD